MRRRMRKLIGTVVMLVFVGVYALTVMALAEGRIQSASTLWLNVFYIFAGLAWIVPLLPLIAWMERPDAEDMVEGA